MAEPQRVERVLSDLRSAVAADAGAALFLPDAGGILRLAAASGEAASVLQPRPRRGLRRPDPPLLGSTLLVPVPDRDGGFVMLARTGRRDFSEDDRAVARLYARQLAAAPVAGPRDSSSWTRQLEVIQRIAARLTRLASVEDVALAIGVELEHLIDYDDCRVFLLEHDGSAVPVLTRAETVRDADNPAAAARAGLTAHLVAWVAAHAEYLLLDDAGRDPRSAAVGERELGGQLSMLLVPLRADGQVTGVIALSAQGARRFDGDDLRLLQVLADQAAVAIENARLLAGRDRLLAELAALLEISQASAQGVDERTLGRALARKLCSAAGVDACVISRWESGSTMLRTLAAFGVDEDDPGYDIVDYPATRAVLRDGRPMVVQADDPGADPAELAVMRQLGQRTMLMLPLLAGNASVGLIELLTHSRRREFSPSDLDFCMTMALQAGTALENARLMEHLRRVADVDQLTGVANHRVLQERLAQEVARANRTGRSLSVLLLDLDGFKEVNDRHGHAEGDRVLRDVAAALRLAVRTNDIVARYGGDEFVVLMPDTAERAARMVAERIVSGVRDRVHVVGDGSEVRLSASAGLAIHPEDGRTPSALLRAADTSMYSVKRAGGGAVERRRTRPREGATAARPDERRGR
ncbi:MAG TPA: sensor domain-containing diguanylate cyclase [Candidatus Limnocylindrales bacterium]|nr:sensor domain-containing diguanylate cyclase [Candidatus Limnocylindrales bacterium]